MTDREMLELAAKAAGTVVEFTNGRPVTFIDGDTVHQAWNPLEDDGDAFRLAVDLSIEIEVIRPRTEREIGRSRANQVWQLHGNDPRAATRLAIVRAAAEVGRRMK